MSVQDGADADTGGAEAVTIDERDERALIEVMSVLDDVGRARGAPGLYLVVSHSGSEYLVDADAGGCGCPDAEYRSPPGGCKHVRRVRMEIGQRPLPAAIDRDAIDDQFGEHITAGVEVSR